MTATKLGTPCCFLLSNSWHGRVGQPKHSPLTHAFEHQTCLDRRATDLCAVQDNVREVQELCTSNLGEQATGMQLSVANASATRAAQVSQASGSGVNAAVNISIEAGTGSSSDAENCKEDMARQYGAFLADSHEDGDMVELDDDALSAQELQTATKVTSLLHQACTILSGTAKYFIKTLLILQTTSAPSCLGTDELAGSTFCRPAPHCSPFCALLQILRSIQSYIIFARWSA
jgi:hypothetical protein